MKTQALLLIFIFITTNTFGQKKADLGICIDPGVSYIVDYFKEDWQPFRPSGSLNLFIEKKGSSISYGTSLQFIHLRTKAYEGDISFTTVDATGTVVTTTFTNQSVLFNSNNIGINFYTRISVKKFQLNLGLLPYKQITEKGTYLDEDLLIDTNSRSYKTIFDISRDYGLGLKFELSYPISEKMKVRFSGMQTYQFARDPVQFTLGLSYHILELGGTAF